MSRKEMRARALAIADEAMRERIEIAVAEAARNNPHDAELTEAIRFLWEQRTSDNWAWCKIEDAFGLMPKPTGLTK